MVVVPNRLPADECYGTVSNDIPEQVATFPMLKGDLEDIIDVPKFQSLMDDFYRLTNIGVAIVDLKGNILVSTGWQDICIKFHRANEQTKARCRESDFYLTQNVKEGRFLAYKCKNHMWDIATPIFVMGKHKGNLFVGQFFYDDETPDYQLFIQQAEKYGFDKEEYLAALGRVPRIGRERIKDMINLNVKLTSLISLIGYTNHNLIEENNQRIRIEETLREKEHFVDRILSADPNGILIYDNNGGNIAFHNPRSIELFEFIPKEMKSISDFIKMKVHPDDISKIEKAIAEMPDLKDYETNEVEIRLLSQMGGSIWTLMHLVPFSRSKDGVLTQILVVMRDVTERIVAEREMSLQLDEIFKTNESLTQTTHELRKSEKALRKASDQLNILNTITRHDAMNQITVIEGFANILEGTDLTPRQTEYVQKMNKAAHAIQVQLEFVKIYQDLGARAPMWHSLIDNVQNARSMLTLEEMELQERDLKVSVWADPMFPKVVYNLIENALRHGGGAKHLNIFTEEKGSDLAIIFQDDGSGISVKDKPHLFERGFGKHTGLGLFLTREILSITNIQIVENSEPGSGARFEILVPQGAWRYT
jgi:PAS domain S-box-containing protein